MDRRTIDAPTVVLVVLAMAGLVNLVEYPAIDAAASDQYEAVEVKDGHELEDLVGGHFPSTKRRFELYVRVAEHAPGVTVTVPEGSQLNDEHFLGLGDVDQVRRRTYPSQVPDDVVRELDQHVVASGESRDLDGEWALAIGSGPVQRLVLLENGQRSYLVDEALLAELGIEVPA